MALNYRSLFVLGASGVTALLFVVGVIVLLIIRATRLAKAKKVGEGDFFERLLATGAEKGSKQLQVGLAIVHFFVVLAGGLAFVFLGSFDYLPFWGAAILAYVLSVAYWAVASDFLARIVLSRRDGEESVKKDAVKQALIQGIPVVIICGFWFLIAYALSSTCVALHPLYVDTRMTRSYFADPCDTNEICHLYLLAAVNMSTEASIVFHAGQQLSAPVVHYGTAPNTYTLNLTAEEFHFEELEKTRFLYYAYLDNLTPDTIYYFKILSGDEKRFKTAPAQFGANSTIKFSTGGDTGITQEMQDFMKDAVAFNPDFVSLGGDLAYDNGLFSCYRRVDSWLNVWESVMTGPSGLIVPLLTAVGNHEYGGFHRSQEDAAFYPRYFVHEKLSGRSPLELPSYRAHYFPGLLQMALDSEVVTSSGGDQQEFVRSTLQSFTSAFPTHWRTAIYHLPMFPGRIHDADISETLRASWEALFSSFQMDASFENHGHTYKRTKLLKDGNVSPTGTIYVGDGTMGVPASAGMTADYLEQTQRAQFYFRVTATASTMTFQGVGVDLAVFDTFNITLNH